MEKLVKYGFVGSHGTGKSTGATYLASKLKEQYRDKSVKIIEENVREISKLFNNEINSTEFQKLCMVDHLQKELTACQIYDIIVCDRTSIDTLVYGLYYGIELPSEYFSLSLNNLNTFDKIYFIRPDEKDQLIAEDGFRDTNTKARNEIDKEFERVLKLWGGNYEEVYSNEIYSYSYLGKNND